MRYNTSRGNLVSSFLLSNSGNLASEDQVRNLVPDDAKFAGFNLLLLTPTTTTTTTPLDSGFASSSSSTKTTTIRYDNSLLVTNHGGGGSVTSRTLSSSERSCGALSNGIIIDSAANAATAPPWPKVQHATEHFPAVVESRSPDPTDVELAEDLFKLLAWVPHTYSFLYFYSILFFPFFFVSIRFFFFWVLFLTEISPTSWQPQDGTISQQRSEIRKTIQIQVSPMPMPSPTASGNNNNNNNSQSVAPYGTRLSTVLLVRNNGQVLFIERDIWELGKDEGGVPVKSEPPTERKYIFKLDIESI